MFVYLFISVFVDCKCKSLKILGENIKSTKNNIKKQKTKHKNSKKNIKKQKTKHKNSKKNINTT